MKAITIRPAVPETDFAELPELLNRVWPEQVTEEILHEWEQNMPEGRIRRRTVAVTADRQYVGYGLTNHHAWEEAGRFLVWVAVAPEARGQGLGGRLYDDGVAFALAHGVKVLDSEVRDNDPDGLRFAEKRGFTIRRHVFESVIDLRSFNESPFTGLVEGVEAGGIRFFSLADAGSDEEVLRKLHAVNYRVVMDDPGTSGSFPSFEEFRSLLYRSSWFVPEGQIMAADGDEVIGLAAVGYMTADNSMTNLVTGVDRGYRGRKIAQALKLLTIRFARDTGAATIRTNNDSENGPMLAINRKLGYRPEPGLYRLAGGYLPGEAE